METGGSGTTVDEGWWVDGKGSDMEEFPKHHEELVEDVLRHLEE